ncbi:MAG: hypothetical protein HY033_01790 [Ignavibacteriae bacterium]|nr:hypothetical protein [Ignavibacteriota bacterium]
MGGVRCSHLTQAEKATSRDVASRGWVGGVDDLKVVATSGKLAWWSVSSFPTSGWECGRNT